MLAPESTDPAAGGLAAAGLAKGQPRRSRAGTRRAWTAQDLAYVAVFAALVAVAAVVPALPAGNLLGVPITIQTMMVILVGLALGAVRAGAALGLYVLLGVMGLPIFSSFRGGPGILLSPGAGYIFGFIAGAIVAGVVTTLLLLRRSVPRVVALSIAALAGTAAIHAMGILGMMVNGKLSVQAAAAADLMFVPGDLLKCAIAVAIVLPLHRAFPELLVRRRGGRRGAP